MLSLCYNIRMLLVGFFGWWYRAGWRDQIRRIGGSLAGTNDFFSIGLLAKTLFAPFRQISANAHGDDIGSRFRAWGDRTFSRLIGAFMRTFMIILGLIAMLFVLIFSLIRIVFWPIVPLLPVVGAVLMIDLGAPWKLV